MRYSLVLLVVLGVHGVLLWLMGQPLIAESGMVKLWHGEVVSNENSQHLSDWYTFSHIIHGIIFYMALSWLFPRASLMGKLLAALVLESGWELFENTDMIINRYREQALAQGYFGDSILNSAGDMCAAALGFWAASRVSVWGSVALIIALEVAALYAIRDSLVLNVVQLVHPIEWIGTWQAS